MSIAESDQLKEIMKEAFSEVLTSNRELIYNVFLEAFEDYHFLEAIKEGETSGKATKEEVFAILEAN